MRAAPPRRRAHAVPGHRLCRHCGHLYRDHFKLCPDCFPAGLQRGATPQTIQPISPCFIIDIPMQPSPAPVYPDWLSPLAADCTASDWELLKLCARDNGRTKLVRDIACALYCFRRAEAIPATVDLAEIERVAVKYVAPEVARR